MVRTFSFILITTFINIHNIGCTQDFTASISGKQNAIVLTPYIDADESPVRNDTIDTDFENNFKCGESKITFDGIIYNTVSFKERCWLDRNLGAKRAAQAPGDKNSFGDYYQWGRLTDGHEEKRSTPTILLSEIDNPGFAGFILTTTAPYDWHTPQNNDLWKDTARINNNPCPDGWKVASKSDFDILLSGNNSILDLYKSPLRIPASGYRDGTSGNIIDVGSKTLLWSSSSKGKKAFAIEAGKIQAKEKKYQRANGLPVRCLKTD